MILIVMFVFILALLLVTKYLEERLGEEERIDQLIKVPKENRGRFTVAGGRANR